MNSHNNSSPLNLSLSTKELEVLWLYDCNFSDQRITQILYLEDQEINTIKNKLYKSFHAFDVQSLLHSAINLGYVHKL